MDAEHGVGTDWLKGNDDQATDARAELRRAAGRGPRDAGGPGLPRGGVRLPAGAAPDHGHRGRRDGGRHGRHHRPGAGGRTGSRRSRQKFVGDEINIVQRETWTSVEQAKIHVTIPGKPGEMSGTGRLDDSGGSTLHVVTLDIKVGIPLVGGKIEGLVSDLLLQGPEGREQGRSRLPVALIRGRSRVALASAASSRARAAYDDHDAEQHERAERQQQHEQLLVRGAARPCAGAGPESHRDDCLPRPGETPHRPTPES